MVAYWKLDEGAGTAANDSVGTNHGTLVNSPTWTAGLVGGALSFDELGQYVELTNEENFDFASGAHTVCFWMKTNAEGVWVMMRKHILGHWNGWSFGVNSRGHNLHLYYATSSGEQNLYLENVVADDTWHFITGVIDVTNAEMLLYIDGELEGNRPIHGTPNENDVNVELGKFDTIGDYDEGRLDEVAIYGRALSEGEIQQLYENGSKGFSYDYYPHPEFVDLAGDDYHLQSEGWRWVQDLEEGAVWTWDEVTSPCIDAGNPGSPLSEELLTIPRDPDNEWGINRRVNMGAYGGTAYASMGPHGWALLADLNNDGVVDMLDWAGQAADWLGEQAELPGDLNRDGIVNLADFALLSEDWRRTTSWGQ